jgi:hypothetical protein
VFNDDSGAATLFSLLGHAATGDREQLQAGRRYLDLAERGLCTLTAMYPNWHLVTSRTCEHARMLLPLALLNKVAPSPEHRQWLETVVDFLISRQAPCGALAEWDGCNPASNAAFFPETPARFVRFDFGKRRHAGSDDWLFLDELDKAGVLACRNSRPRRGSDF